MNAQDAAAVLYHLSLGWPHYRFNDDTAALWAQHLADVERRDAELATEEIIRTDERFPSIARFLAVCQAKAKLGRPGVKAIAGPAPDHNANLAHIRDIRSILKRVDDEGAA